AARGGGVMTWLLRPVPELDSALAATLGARLAALATAEPSDAAREAGRQRLLAALAAAGPAREPGSRARRAGFAALAAAGGLAAVSVAGALTGQEELKAPIAVVEKVAESIGLKDAGPSGGDQGRGRETATTPTPSPVPARGGAGTATDPATRPAASATSGAVE